MKYRKIRIYIRIFGYSALALLLLWLANEALVPGGKKVYIKQAGGDSNFISRFAPNDRLLEGKEGGPAKMISDPVYFSLKTPRAFDKARITIEMSIPEDIKDGLPIAQLGIMRDPVSKSYELFPLYNLKLDELGASWDTTKDSGLVLYQKKKRYGSIGDFLASPPPFSKIAAFNHTPDIPYRLDGYKAGGEDRILASGLRGGYEIWVYKGEENLDFDFTLYDLNRNLSNDEVKIQLLSGSRILKEEISSDKSASDEIAKITARGNIRLEIGGLSEGAYKIKVSASDDIVTSRIKTRQTLLAFNHGAWLVDPEAYGTGAISAMAGKLYTDSDEIFVKTMNPASLQKITFGSSTLRINETFKQFSLKSPGGGLKELRMEKGDLIIAGNGTFAFEDYSHLNPSLKPVDKYWDKNSSGTEFVIAKYESPKKTDGTLVVSADIGLNSAYREKGAYGFLLSVPGLSAGDPVLTQNRHIALGDIKIELLGDTLWKMLKKYLSGLKNKLI